MFRASYWKRHIHRVVVSRRSHHIYGSLTSWYHASRVMFTERKTMRFRGVCFLCSPSVWSLWPVSVLGEELSAKDYLQHKLFTWLYFHFFMNKTFRLIDLSWGGTHFQFWEIRFRYKHQEINHSYHYKPPMKLHWKREVGGPVIWCGWGVSHHHLWTKGRPRTHSHPFE